jgi:hypothetical protein
MPDPPKFTQIWILGFKTYHLATALTANFLQDYWIRGKKFLAGNNRKKTFTSFRRPGRPDLANFRPMGDCLLWAIF